MALSLTLIDSRVETMVSYDQIGSGYSRTRRADARIVERITALLSLPIGSRVVDIGAGTGNYSNAIAEKGYQVVAVEPSAAMRYQAQAHSSVVWQAGCAEALPLNDAAVDGAICILAFHHFSDHRQALREARRVTGGGPIVLFTWEPRVFRTFWLFDYFPDIREDDGEMFPPIESVAGMIEEHTGLCAAIGFCASARSRGFIRCGRLGASGTLPGSAGSRWHIRLCRRRSKARCHRGGSVEGRPGFRRLDQTLWAFGNTENV